MVVEKMSEDELDKVDQNGGGTDLGLHVHRARLKQVLQFAAVNFHGANLA